MRIVILGGGFGGINAAIKLKKLLQHTEHKITIVSQSNKFCFRPSLVWVPFDERKVDEITLPLEDFMKKEGIEFLVQQVVRVEPGDNRVLLEDHDSIQYDYLLIATGAKPDYEIINGLKKNTHSIYYTEDALRTKEAIHSLKDGDHVVIGVTQGNPNPLPAYEFLFELDAFLKKKEINANLTLLTYEKKLIEVASDEMTEHFIKHFQDKNISFMTNTQIKKVRKHNLVLSHDDVIPYTFLLILPPYKGADYICKSNLNHENGLIPVDETLLSTEWDNIYAAGDACLLPSHQMIKSGWAAELQGKIAGENISTRILKEGKPKQYKDHMLSLIDLGTDGGLFSFKNHLFQFTLEGTSPHLLKVALEKYYLKKFSV